MAILLIGEKERADITAALARARSRPLPLEFLRAAAIPDDCKVLKLSDRKPGPKRPQAEQVLIPIGYRAAVSFEEQPAGMCMHLSISVERADPKSLPSIESVKAIAREFGMDFWNARQQGLTWLEEYEPGRHAINVVMVTAPRPVGHA